MTNAERQAAAIRVAKARHATGGAAAAAIPGTNTVMLAPSAASLALPDYFGNVPNYANSPLPTSVSIQGDGTGAFATANVNPDGTIGGFNLISQGAGYTFANVVVIGGGGSGATGTATVTAGSVTAIAVGNAGSGYGSAPGLRKFVDSLPMIGSTPNDLGQYLPVAVADTTTFGAAQGDAPAADYYEIAVVQYTKQMHADLPATSLRGYVQIETPVVKGKHIQLFYPDGVTPILDATGQPVFAVDSPQYLGPIIVAQKDRPIRVKFDNYLPTGTGGDLFLPVDATVMGAGAGPNGGSYSENRATLHLHGGITPWISDGTADQWTTPAGATEQYPRGVSSRNVPDMWFDASGNDVAACDGLTTCSVAGSTTDPGAGHMTFYYTNQQSARLMFYHDHAYGITRLNVYAGEAAGFLLQDQAEAALVSAGTLPGLADNIPLVIQDRTFVPSAAQLAAEDPTWSTSAYGAYGNLWFPHTYMPNQNPGDVSGANAMGRWDYGPWFWPPNTQIQNGEVPNPLCTTPGVQSTCPPGENAFNPGTPNPSIVPEAFMDTMTVNGTAYPFVQVGQKQYRLRVLNASNDRSLNLSLYYAGTETGGAFVPCNGATWSGNTLNANGCSGEVPMVPAVNGGAGTAGYTYPDQLDGRQGGVPDSRAAGPSMIQIGSEGGFLPKPATIANGPVGYNYNRRDIVVLNVSSKSLFLGPAERADVVVDFSGVPDGSTLILYNDAPAPTPAFDTRYDYYTGDPDQIMTGGAPSTLPGYGPNTRTVLQFQVGMANGTGPAVNQAALGSGITSAYAQMQPAPVVPQQAYDPAFGTTSPADPYVRIQNTQTTFNTCYVDSLTLGASGTGYTTAPAVSITGGGGSGAKALASIGAPVANLTLTNGGSGYTSAPAVAFSGGGGSGASAAAALSPTTVAGLTLASGGSGFSSAPAVTISGGGGSGATASATLATRSVASISLTTGGSGYSATPSVTLSGGGGSGATASAVLAPGGVGSVAVTRGGTGYTSAPTVVFTGGGGTGATATATIAGGAITAVSVTNPGTGYTSAPSVSFTGGGGRNATATATLSRSVQSITLTKAGSGYTSAPTVAITGGGGSGAAATAVLTTASIASLTLTAAGSGFTSAPTVSFSGGGGTGAAATARLTATTVASLTLLTGGSYLTTPTVSFTGGGGGTGAAATAALGPAQVTGVRLTNPGSGYVANPTVTISGGGGSGATATATFKTTAATVGLGPKGIQELFEVFYGRMNATMSVEIPNTNGVNQTTIPYGYVDPPTEVVDTSAFASFPASSSASPIAMLPDGTQIWKFTHNGVDTHAIHFHMFNIQVINRVGWDGAIRAPDPNELGWKDTVRMNPLEDAIIAIKPIVPDLPWQLPNSIRPLDVTSALGTSGPQYTNVDPTGQPVTVVNRLVNFGWEYTYHCHLLGHEENDMMRPMAIGIAPASPSGVTAARSGKNVVVTFTDNSINETGFTVQRSPDGGATWTTIGTVLRAAPTLNANGSVNDFGLSTGSIVTFTDTTFTKGTTYLYRAVANDLIGDTQQFAAPAVGYPTESVDSVPSAPSASVTP